METGNKIKFLMNSCDIMFDNKVISDQPIIAEYIDFLSKLVFSKEKSAGLLLHTGSLTFDIVTIVFNAVAALLLSTETTNGIIDDLEIGDYVLYENNRWEYRGECDLLGESRILLSRVRKERGVDLQVKEYLRSDQWHKILPYYGDAEMTGGKGVRKNKSVRKKFLSDILGVDEDTIPEMVNTSSVMVISKEDIDYYIDKISLRYGGCNEINLIDLVTISYFTENGEFTIGKNPGKVEAVLKLTSKVSVARDLVLRPEDHRIIGLSVLGTKYVQKARTEIDEFINDKSLDFLVFSTEIEYFSDALLIENNPELQLFPCTKEFLQKPFPESVLHFGYFSSELKRQIFSILNCDFSVAFLDSGFDYKKYNRTLRYLLQIKSSDFLCADKDYFIIQSYSLLKLFRNACFSMKSMENVISKNMINAESPLYRLGKLKDIAKTFMGEYLAKATFIVEFLDAFYNTCLENTLKEDYLKKEIYSRKYKKIAVIVPNEYYKSILLSEEWLANAKNFCRISISTANRFDKSNEYDLVIATGLFEGSKFNAFRYRMSDTVLLMVYDFEKEKYEILKKSEQHLIDLYNFHAGVITSMGVDNENQDLDEEIEENQVNESVLDDFVTQLRRDMVFSSIYSDGRSSMSEAVWFVTFSGGESAFFSKYYKPYIVDANGSNARDIVPEKLCPGDILVFSQRNDETKDVVDIILKQILNSDIADDGIRKAYKDSNYWKEKLISYSDLYDLSVTDISKELKMFGCNVSVGAVRDWLDPDSHTVGPRDIESYYSIGKLVNDLDLVDNPGFYQDACSVIRSMRRKILHQIGITMMGNLNFGNKQEDLFFKTVAEHAENIVSIMQIDSIESIEPRMVPSYMLNRPLVGGGE